MVRLLILACSERKVRTKGLLPALDRYDGPAFRVLRKYLRECPQAALTVLIASAKYGLIASGQQIPWYDHRLTGASAARLQSQVQEVARGFLQSNRWQAVAVCAGKQYLSALQGLAGLLPVDARFHHLAGGLGKRLTALRDWLHREFPADPDVLSREE